MTFVHAPAFRDRLFIIALSAALLLARPGISLAQDKAAAPPDRAKVLAAAREIMIAQPYCGLVTLDETSMPQIRTMNPFLPDEDMVVWMATNTNSRKVQHIRRDPRVSLYYSDHSKGTGYVAIVGRAVLVDDMKEILKRKRDYWDTAFPGLKNLVLIKVIPERLDVVNYKQGFGADPLTFRATSIALTGK